MRRRRDVGKGSSKVKWGQILIDSPMDAKLGGLSRHPMPKMLKVGYGSSKVNWGQILTDSRIEVKLGG